MAARNYHKGASYERCMQYAYKCVYVYVILKSTTLRLASWLLLAICQEYYGIRLIVRN